MIRTDGEINAQVKGLPGLRSFPTKDMIPILWPRLCEIPESC